MSELQVDEKNNSDVRISTLSQIDSYNASRSSSILCCEYAAFRLLFARSYSSAVQGQLKDPARQDQLSHLE